MRSDAPQVYLNFASGDAVTTALADELGHERISGEICKSILRQRTSGTHRTEGIVAIEQINFRWQMARTPFDFGPLTWWVIVELVKPKHLS